MKKWTKKSFTTGYCLLLFTVCFMGLITTGCSKGSVEQAHEWEWHITAGGTETDFCMGLDVDDNGNIYVTGYFNETALFGDIELESQWESDIFIGKMNRDREWLWVQQCAGLKTGSGAKIIVDDDGNSYVTGRFKGIVDIGGTAFNAGESFNTFIAKLDTDGEWLWVRIIAASVSVFSTFITVDADDNYYLTGSYEGKATFGDREFDSGDSSNMFVAKINSDGEWLDVISIETSIGGGISGLGFDNEGNRYLAGNFSGTAIFGDVELVSEVEEDLFVAKLNKLGDWVWAVNGQTSNESRAMGITVDSGGNSYVTGRFGKTGEFGSHKLTAKNYADIFIAKLDRDGEWLWARRAGGTLSDSGSKVILGKNEEHIYVAGTYSSSGNIWKTLISSFLKINFEKADFGRTKLPVTMRIKPFLTKLSSDGEWLWATTTENDDDIFIWDATVDSAENIYLAGNYLFDNTVITTEGVSGVSYWNIYIAKLKYGGSELYGQDTAPVPQP